MLDTFINLHEITSDPIIKKSLASIIAILRDEKSGDIQTEISQLKAALPTADISEAHRQQIEAVLNEAVALQHAAVDPPNNNSGTDTDPVKPK